MSLCLERQRVMNLYMPEAELAELVRTHARTALDSRQVARRLSNLLKTRLDELQRAHRSAAGAAGARRQAAIDQAYLNFVQELLTVRNHSLTAKIQYETHLMLVEARRSLRALRRR